MGLIEIILTIVAWTVGKWKWLALIPIGVALCLGALIGTISPQASPDSVIWVDILAIIALAIMSIVKKKETPNVHDNE